MYTKVIDYQTRFFIIIYFQPILLTSQFEMEDGIPVRGKLELHYSQSDKVLTLEVESQFEEEQKSLEYKLYREGKYFDLASLNLAH